MNRSQLAATLRLDLSKPAPDGWKHVIYKSIYSDEHHTGCLKPGGDIVGWFDGFIPAGWMVLSHKNEVKEIISYL